MENLKEILRFFYSMLVFVITFFSTFILFSHICIYASFQSVIGIHGTITEGRLWMVLITSFVFSVMFSLIIATLGRKFLTEN